jgi:hypothetical protein
MIPKRSRRRVTPVLRFVEGGQLSLEQHHYSPGVDNPEAPLSAKKRPVASESQLPGKVGSLLLRAVTSTADI